MSATRTPRTFLLAISLIAKDSLLIYKFRAVTKPVEIYQIKVTLRDSQPPIWRRIQVRSDNTLAKFHRVLQRVMGWEDAHLHRFVIQGVEYGTREHDEGEPRKTRDEREYTLSDLAVGGQFVYHYDFGDNWEHTVEIEEMCLPDRSLRYPVCLAGVRACPPEDVGGIPGYENFLNALSNPDHPEHHEYLEWIGDTFDPDEFDVNKVNQKLRGIR